LIAEMTRALNGSEGSEAIIKIALRPILQSGNKRYQVMDEMILVKEELSKLPPDRAFNVLKTLVE
jgi:hypothetical protein